MASLRRTMFGEPDPRKSFNRSERNIIASNQDWKCNFCHESFGPLWEIDHMIPLKFSGTNDMLNLQALCHSCHHFKTHYLDDNHIQRVVKYYLYRDYTFSGSELRKCIERIQRDNMSHRFCKTESQLSLLSRDDDDDLEAYDSYVEGNDYFKIPNVFSAL